MKKLVVVLSIAVLALAGGTLYLWRQLDAERKLNADLQQRMQALESAQQSFASFFNRREPAADTTAPQESAPPVDPAAARARREQNAREALNRTREALNTPEARQVVSGMVRAFLPMMLPDLAKELNLSPAEMDKFMELLSRQTDGVIGQFAGGASAQQMAGNVEEMRQKGDAEIAAFLGDKYPQWKEYEGSLQARQQVNQLQTTLAASGNKLSDAQTRPLIAALSAEQKRIAQDAASNSATQSATPEERRQLAQQRTTENNRRLVDAAAPYMTAQQLEAYKASLNRPNRGTIGGLGGIAGMMGGQGGAAQPR